MLTTCCVYFTFQLLLVTPSHHLKNSNTCSGGQSVIRHEFKDKANREISFNRILNVISVRDRHTAMPAVSLVWSQSMSHTWSQCDSVFRGLLLSAALKNKIW